MNISTIAILLALSPGALACGANAIDLDASTIEASNEPGVLAVVNERIEKLALDDERLYWVGSHLQQFDASNTWFLRSCKKDHCAGTLVTYDAQPSFESKLFAVNDGQVYWYRSSGRELVACPIAGCNGAPRKLATDLELDAAAFDDERLYLLAQGSLDSLPLSQPETRQVLARTEIDRLSVSVEIHDEYAYWQVLGTDDRESLVRTRKDGSSTVETIARDVRRSHDRDFSITTDATSIYWTNNLLVGSINRCPIAGCTDSSETVIAPLQAPNGVLTDGRQLYFQYEAEPFEYLFSSCSLPACTNAEPLLTRLDAPGAFTMDAQYLYAATTEQDVSPRTEEETVARLRRLPKPDRELQ